ncbi:hypothetical protein L9F63_001505, partial [Diploptera punctata]
VFISYCLCFCFNKREERKIYNQTVYHFTCKCRACTEDWPLLDLLPDVKPTFICN